MVGVRVMVGVWVMVGESVGVPEIVGLGARVDVGGRVSVMVGETVSSCTRVETRSVKGAGAMTASMACWRSDWTAGGRGKRTAALAFPGICQGVTSLKASWK